jgi:hypothetical protein
MSFQQRQQANPVPGDGDCFADYRALACLSLVPVGAFTDPPVVWALRWASSITANAGAPSTHHTGSSLGIVMLSPTMSGRGLLSAKETFRSPLANLRTSRSHHSLDRNLCGNVQSTELCDTAHCFQYDLLQIFLQRNEDPVH